MSEREFDVVVYGATGFTGELVAESLRRRYPPGALRWAIAGRSEGKLAEVGARLSELGQGEPPQGVIADSGDPASLRAMCARTRVVITTVGPYARYGEPLVEAAIAEGTHTADLTGEPQYVRRLIDRHHQAAQRAGVRIVNCCGFDSIPSDLGNLVLQRSGPFSTVESVVWASRGGFSGGTAASMVQVMEEAQDPAVRRILADPYALDPGGEGTSPTRELRSVRYSEHTGGYVAPWLMAAINEKVVRRSNALLGYPWGRDLSFQEVLRTGSGIRSGVASGVIAGGMGLSMVALASGVGRRVAKRLLAVPGEGPSRELIDGGFFELRLFGATPDGQTGVVRVRGDRDPGYGATSHMIAESGVALALDADRLELTGIVTPAAALGDVLVDRLTRVGITFEPEAP